MKRKSVATDIHSILQRYEQKKEHLILMLHDIQNHNEHHYISESAIHEVSRYLNITHSEIYGVISFYTMLSTKPRGKYIIRVCNSAPCHVMHSEDIIEEIKKTLGIDFGMTTKDGLFTLESTSCLGICDLAPAVMINDEIYGKLTRNEITKILAEKSK